MTDELTRAWASFQLGQAWASLEAAAQNLKRAGHNTAADEARHLAERVFQIQRRTFGSREDPRPTGGDE